ncbi:hypothetical protein PVK06_009252 [Gossypium arboreum]|uniref:Ty3 transposon capsid-like protein domain-containing protein n=1 Tax=Gossypium arboreum TaxID=29729 RepID=A0ABR0QLW6_GOSAR|nr:hypothetical protein PVK06_009252 [Gossypium arboreum]
MQKDMRLMQQELTQLQTNLAQMDARMESRFKEFHENVKVGIHIELQKFFEQRIGHATPPTQGQTSDKGKGVLGGTPPRFPPKESLLLSPMVESSHIGIHSRASTLDSMGRNFKFKYSRFHGKALDWHYFFSQRQGGLQMLSWETYARSLQERLGSSNFTDAMTELVTLKQQGTVDLFHDQFVSILNQLHLPKPYALSIFISNLKAEVGQYIRLFKPQTLVEVYMLARHVEGIVSTNIIKRPPLVGGSGGYSKPLFFNPKPISHVPAFGGSLSNLGHQKTPLNSHRTPTKSFSQAGIEDRRKKGLCFWCNAKYAPGHKCVKSQLYQLVVGSHNELGVETITLQT